MILSFLCRITAVQATDTGAGAGAGGFNTHCAFCHQTSGQGLAGQFPPLAGRVNPIAASPAGRKYLASVVLYGMAGQITVDGAPIVGFMPPLGTTLNDDEVASILNYVLHLQKNGKVARFTAKDIRSQRHTPPLAPADVLAMRRELESSKVIQH